MPILKDFREVKKIILPLSGGSVEIFNSLLVGDVSGVGEKTNVWLKYIKSWDFTNEAGEVLPINEENFNLLPAKDFTVLMTEINDLEGLTKKD